MNADERVVKELIEAGRAEPGPTPLDRERLRGRVQVAVAAGTGAVAASAWAGKVVAAVTVGALLGAAGYLSTRSASPPTEPEPLPEVARALEPVSSPAVPVVEVPPVPPAEAPLVAPLSPRLKRQPVVRAPPVVAPPPAPAAPSVVEPERFELAAEVKGLREVYDALKAGRAEAALEMLEAQDARFRTGQLSPERQGARVLAQCQLRRFELGLAGLEAFERANPGSSLLPRLRAACGAKAP